MDSPYCASALIGEIDLGKNATIEVDIEYNFLEVPLTLTIIDQDAQVRGEAGDTIQGNGKKTLTISMETKENDDASFFAAIAYYFIDGKWTYMDPNGYLPFTLGQGGATSTPEGSELPDGIDISNLNMDQITSTLNNTLQKELELLKDVEIPDELSNIERARKLVSQDTQLRHFS